MTNVNRCDTITLLGTIFTSIFNISLLFYPLTSILQKIFFIRKENDTMTGFDAYFYGNKIFINGKKEYKLGEILTKYLSRKFKKLDDLHHKCQKNISELHYPEDKSKTTSCNKLFQNAMTFYSNVDDLICSMPPFNVIDFKRNSLYDLLNEYDWLFKEDYDEDGIELDYLEHFNTELPLCDYHDADLIDGVLDFNEKLKLLATEYLVFIEDLMRVKKVYEPFLETLHSKSRYFNNTETANVVSEFLGKTNASFNDYEKLKSSGSIQISYKVIEHKKCPVLCESYHFDTIGAFLYIELFKGLESHFLPKKCGYCERYFLLEAGIFSDYCTRVLKDAPDKICRDVGHRKKYADKIKNDPIWLAYSRAYKQHYARFLKKKMSQSEFQQWADLALELRQLAIDGEIEFEEFRGRIRV